MSQPAEWEVILGLPNVNEMWVESDTQFTAFVDPPPIEFQQYHFCDHAAPFRGVRLSLLKVGERGSSPSSCTWHPAWIEYIATNGAVEPNFAGEKKTKPPSNQQQLALQAFAQEQHKGRVLIQCQWLREYSGFVEDMKAWSEQHIPRTPSPQRSRRGCKKGEAPVPTRRRRDIDVKYPNQAGYLTIKDVRGPFTTKHFLGALKEKENWDDETVYHRLRVMDALSPSGIRDFYDILSGDVVWFQFGFSSPLSLFGLGLQQPSHWYPVVNGTLPKLNVLLCFSGAAFLALWPEAGATNTDWTPAVTSLQRMLSDEYGLSSDEFHWRARCLCPSPGYCWTPETDKYWPLLFRKIIRCCLKIRVREGHLHHLPHDVVSVIGGFL